MHYVITNADARTVDQMIREMADQFGEESLPRPESHVWDTHSAERDLAMRNLYTERLLDRRKSLSEWELRGKQTKASVSEVAMAPVGQRSELDLVMPAAPSAKEQALELQQSRPVLPDVGVQKKPCWERTDELGAAIGFGLTVTFLAVPLIGFGVYQGVAEHNVGAFWFGLVLFLAIMTYYGWTAAH